MTSKLPSETSGNGAAGSSKRAQTEPLSAELSRQLALLVELQKEAQITDDGTKVEKLSKAIVATSKQLQAQRLLERETLSWEDLLRFARDFAIVVAEELRAEFTDQPERVCDVIKRYAARMESIAEKRNAD